MNWTILCCKLEAQVLWYQCKCHHGLSRQLINLSSNGPPGPRDVALTVKVQFRTCLSTMELRYIFKLQLCISYVSTVTRTIDSKHLHYLLFHDTMLRGSNSNRTEPPHQHQRLTTRPIKVKTHSHSTHPFPSLPSI